MSSNPTLATAAFRISSQQERTWLERERGVQPFAQCVIRIEGPLDASKLESVLRQVVTRYEILRTVLRRQTGVKLPFQVIRDEAQLHFAQVAANDEIEELLWREREALPGAEEGPALRALLIAAS